MLVTKNNVQEASLSAVIIRVDGSKEDLGQVAYFHKSFIKRIIWKIKKFLKE